MDIDRIASRLSERQFLRFLVAGGVNTLFGLGVYIACVMADLPVWSALLVGMVAGTAFNFVTLGGYAFRDMSVRRLPRFVLAYLSVYLINLIALHLLRQFIASAVWCQIVLTPPAALLSYALMSRLVFTKKAAG